MQRRLFIAAAFSAFGVAVACGQATIGSAGPVDVSAEIEPILAKQNVPGIAAAIIQGDRIVMLGAAGVRANGKPERVTTTDQWHLGSCTKSMTATVCAMMVEEGTLRWDMPVADAFPELGTRVNEGWRAVTLKHVLTNRGGAPGEVPRPLWARLRSTNETPAEQRRMLAEGILIRKPEAEPGAKYIYSNAGFSIAGAIAERAAGEPWEELMRRRLFEPLGLKSAGFGSPGLPGSYSQPRGHTADGQPRSPTADSDNPAAIGPAGTVHMSIVDWAKYISLHMRADKENPNRVVTTLKAETFDLLHAPEGAYAMGWGIADRPWADGPVITHSGSNNSWYAVVWIAPRKDFAALACCNKGGDAGSRATDAAVWMLIQKHLGLKPE